jgi:hypothetical protein
MDRVRSSGPVEEEKALAVVDLVLQGTRLEGVGLDRHLGAGAGCVTAYDDPGRALHVAGEVGNSLSPGWLAGA